MAMCMVLVVCCGDDVVLGHSMPFRNAGASRNVWRVIVEFAVEGRVVAAIRKKRRKSVGGMVASR